MPRKPLRIEIPFAIHARPQLRRVLRSVEAYATGQTPARFRSNG
jgi:hypothetical protein